MRTNESRKKKENRSEEVHFRVTPRERDMLKHLCMETGKSKTEIFREALETHYKMAKYIK